MVTRRERVAKEIRDGKALESAARRLAETLHDPDTEPAAQAAVARELRMLLKDMGDTVRVQEDRIDQLASRRRARRGA